MQATAVKSEQPYFRTLLVRVQAVQQCVSEEHTDSRYLQRWSVRRWLSEPNADRAMSMRRRTSASSSPSHCSLLPNTRSGAHSRGIFSDVHPACGRCDDSLHNAPRFRGNTGFRESAVEEELALGVKRSAVIDEDDHHSSSLPKHRVDEPSEGAHIVPASSSWSKSSLSIW